MKKIRFKFNLMKKKTKRKKSKLLVKKCSTCRVIGAKSEFVCIQIKHDYISFQPNLAFSYWNRFAKKIEKSTQLQFFFHWIKIFQNEHLCFWHFTFMAWWRKIFTVNVLIIIQINITAVSIILYYFVKNSLSCDDMNIYSFISINSVIDTNANLR